MPSVRSLLLLVSLWSLCGARPQQDVNRIDEDVLDLRELVDDLPREFLDAALHDHLAPKYRDGVFEDSMGAIDALHSDDPELATRVVEMAVQEVAGNEHLQRRQNSNSTTTPSTTVETTTSPVIVTDTSTTAVSLTTQTVTSTTGSSPPQGASQQQTTAAQQTTTQGQSTSTAQESTTIEGRTTTISPTTIVTSSTESQASTTFVVVQTSTQSGGATVEPASSTQGQTSSVNTAPASGQTSEATTAGTTNGETAVSSSSAVAVSETSVGQGSQSVGGTTVPITTTNEAGSTVVTSEVAQNTVAASTPSPVTTTNAAGSTVVSTPAAITGGTVTGGGGATPISESGFLVPVVASSTDSAGSVVQFTTSAFESSAPTSIEVPITTTNAQGSTITTSSLVPAAVITSTNAQGQVVTTTSPLASVVLGSGGHIITSAPAAGASAGSMSAITTTDQYGNSVVLSGNRYGEVITTTDAHGRTVTLTYTPGGGEVSQLVLQTTSLPNGQKSTITSLAVVGGVDTTTTRPPGASTSKSGSHGLQSGIAAPTGRYVGEIAALVGGAIGVAAFL